MITHINLHTLLTRKLPSVAKTKKELLQRRHYYKSSSQHPCSWKNFKDVSYTWHTSEKMRWLQDGLQRLFRGQSGSIILHFHFRRMTLMNWTRWTRNYLHAPCLIDYFLNCPSQNLTVNFLQLRSGCVGRP